VPSRSKCLIYGSPGVGKTFTALDFPTVYFIDTEGGANLPHYTDKLERSGGVYLGPSEGAGDFATVLEQIKALAEEEHPFRTLIIDSISKLFNDTVAREADRLALENKKDEFGASKKPAVAYMRRLVSWLTRLDMNVILVAHAKDEYAPGDAKGERVVIGRTYDCWDKLEYELDLCLQIERRGASRVAMVRKSRLEGFPPASTLPWSYDEFAARYGREKLEAQAKAIALASAEQVAELDRLLGNVRMPEGWLGKCLDAAGVDQSSELTAEQIGKMINVVKEKLS
jgi:KaiC/GvpD/RAD55 family RecA-like ATPase